MEINTVANIFMLVGFIIGLGAVTVIDIHGFLGRKSHYWTEATTRTHKVTKPLIWLGIMLLSIGVFLGYTGWMLIAQTIIIVVLITNGIFLSFSVSPYMLKREKNGEQSQLLPKAWQNKITASFVLSFMAWWSSVVLFIMYIS
jgi:predicted ABC-type exoprotein transport system permease subunit